MDKFIRTYEGNIRSAEGSRSIEGYACVFGQRSVLMMDWDEGPVYEVIERSAIDDAVIGKSDIIANINHDDSHMLARSVNGSGSLSLSLDDNGLKVSFDAPKTADGDTVLEGVRRNDFRGMSFGFWCDRKADITYTREEGKDGKDIVIRHINKIRGLFDVSVVTHPAYPDTSVETRSALQEEIRAALNIQPKEVRSEEMKRDYDRLRKMFNN